MSQHAEKCPVCEGKTTMPPNFYPDRDDDDPLTCRSCEGKGYIVVGETCEKIVPSPYPYYPYPVYPNPINPWQPYTIFASDHTTPMPLGGRWI